jgi:WhiB family redox-sensing transcriptional regulator
MTVDTTTGTGQIVLSGDLMTVEPVWAFEIRTPCRTNDPELWFAQDVPTVQRAQELCRVCPLASECLAGAIARREPWGVWGGEVFEQGEVVARKRRPGRPRKDAHVTAAMAEAELAQRLSRTVDEGATRHSTQISTAVSIPAQRDGAAA